MSNVDTHEEAPQPWVPRVIAGGKGPTDTLNWLADYAVGTTFVSRNRNAKEVDLNLYHVIFKSLPSVVLLKWQLPDGKILDYYVDPLRFSKQFEPGTILGVMVEETNEHNQDRPPDVVHDAPTEGEHRVDGDRYE